MELEELLTQDFREHNLFKQAVTHRSRSKNHNERLEFLGDAVLQLLISEYLYNHFATVPEGQLTRMRARLVRKETLSEIAEKLQLRAWLRIGRGENRAQLSDAVLADAMEAIIGAYYLNHGLQPTRQFIVRIYKNYLKHLSGSDSFIDAKTQLQEYMQAYGHPLPEYRLRKSTSYGFRVVCEVALGRAEGEGKTKREAEKQAAHAMLEKLEGKQ